MNNAPGLSRRAALAASGGAALLALTACGSSSSGTGSSTGSGDDSSKGKTASGPRTVKDAYGRSVTIKSTAKVVALSEPTLDAALALGLHPVATTAGRGQPGAPGYLTEKAGDIPVVATVAEPDLEKIAALQPDLILLDETVGAKKSVDKLAAIAPTFVCAKLKAPWRDAFRTAASAVGKKSQAAALLKKFDADIAATKSKLGADKGATVSVIRWQDGKPSITGVGNGPVGETLKGLGLKRPAGQQGAGVGHSEPISPEKLDTIDADWMFFGGLSDEANSKKLYAEAQKVPNWSKLNVQRKKHVVVIDGAAWNSAGGPIAARNALSDITAALT